MNGHCVGYYNSSGKLESATYFNGPTAEVVNRLIQLGFTQLRPECTEHDRAICRNPLDGRWAIAVFSSDNTSDVFARVVAINTAVNTEDIIPQLNNELARLQDASSIVS